MKRILLWTFVGLILLAGVFWGMMTYFISKPMYIPGTLQATTSQAALKAPPQNGVQAGYWKMADHVLLYHFENGTGEPVLVLHGGPGIPFDEPWRGLEALNGTCAQSCAQARRGYRFYYYHQRGCGKSSRPVDRFSSQNYYQNVQTLNETLGFKAQLADMERIRQILGQEKITLIGHSFGGFLATLYAIEFPDRVKKLILVSPADLIKMPQKDGGLYEVVKQKIKDPSLQKEYAEFLKRFFDYGRIFSKNEAQLRDLNFRFTKYYEAAYQNEMSTGLGLAAHQAEFGGWVTPALFFGLGQKHDYSDSLRKIKCPVLIIRGGRDLTRFSYYQQNISHLKLQTIPSAGHFSFNEKPAEFAKAMQTFMDQP